MPYTICFNSGKKLALNPGNSFSLWVIEVEAHFNNGVTIRKSPYYKNSDIARILVNEVETSLKQPKTVTANTTIMIEKINGLTVIIEIMAHHKHRNILKKRHSIITALQSIVKKRSLK